MSFQAFVDEFLRRLQFIQEDETYADLAVPAATALKAIATPPRVILAGAPGDREQELRAAGVDEFINLRSDALDIIGRLAAATEVSP